MCAYFVRFSVCKSWFKKKEVEEVRRQKKFEKQPTYLESCCRYGALSVAVVQWDDGDNILSVVPQVEQSVECSVTSKLHSLHVSTFVGNKNTSVFPKK